MGARFRHCCRWWGLRFFGALLLAQISVGAQEPAKPGKSDLPRFPAEVEEKFSEILKKSGELKSSEELAELKKEISQVVKVTGLDEAGQKALEARTAAVVEGAVKEWLEKMETMIRTGWEGVGDFAFLDQWLAQPSMFIRNVQGTDYVRATEQAAWSEALAAVLDPKQAAAWKTVADERRRKFDEQIKGVIAASKARFKEQHAQQILGTASAIASTVSLDAPRRKRLEAFAEQAAEKASEPVQEKVRKMLLALDEPRRKQIAKTNSFYIAPDENDAPEKQEVWKNGLREVLTPEELARWEAAIKKRRERRVSSFAQVLIWTMDQVVAFTAQQREQLQALAGECVQNHKGLLSESRTNYYSSVTADVLLQAASRAKEEDLRKVLDPLQLEHWKEAPNPKSRARAAVRQVFEVSPTRTVAKPASFEPEELETALSDYLYEMANREQEQALADAILRVEDATRVAGLEGKAVERLQTAARGAMEHDLGSWRTNTATSMRSQLRNVAPADLQQRLAGVGSYSVRRRLTSGKDAKGIWEKAVAAELTETQRAAWQKEVDARKAYERQTAAAAVLITLDQITLLSDEQWTKLDGVLTKQLEEYTPEFDQMFSNRNPVWFLQTYNVLTPLAGIPEKELRAILTEDKWKQLSSANQFSNAQNYWRNIESYRKQRAQRTKAN